MLDGIPNENKMRHNLSFRNKITIEIQNLSPLARSPRNEFFRSRSRPRLTNSHFVCLQTLSTLFFRLTVSKIMNSACVYVDWYFDVSLVVFSYHDKPLQQKRNLITNTTKKNELIWCSRSDVIRVLNFGDSFSFTLLNVNC